jgi:hypothetical protein
MAPSMLRSQTIQVIVIAPDGSAAPDAPMLLAACRRHICMAPVVVEGMAAPLPRNPNGMIDRKLPSTQRRAPQEAARGH